MLEDDGEVGTETSEPFSGVALAWSLLVTLVRFSSPETVGASVMLTNGNISSSVWSCSGFLSRRILPGDVGCEELSEDLGLPIGRDNADDRSSSLLSSSFSFPSLASDRSRWASSLACSSFSLNLMEDVFLGIWWHLNPVSGGFSVIPALDDDVSETRRTIGGSNLTNFSGSMQEYSESRSRVACCVPMPKWNGSRPREVPRKQSFGSALCTNRPFGFTG